MISKYADKTDDILKYYREHGHRKTLSEYGSYAIHYLRRNKLWIRTQNVVPVFEDVFLQHRDRYYWALVIRLNVRLPIRENMLDLLWWKT